MRHDPIALGTLHDGYCRCQSCKPSPANQHGMTAADLAFALLAVIVCLTLAATMPGGL